MSDAPTLSPKAQKPGHVVDSAVYDFDLYADPALIKDAHERVAEIAREAPPVFWTPRNGGQWFLKSYQALFDASRDPDTFTSEYIPFEQIQAMRASLPEGAPHIVMPVPINLDPPEHTKYRSPLLKAFSPKTMNTLKDDIRALAVELIENVKPDGQCEFMAAVAEPMPVQVFLKIFGLPVERQAEYRALVKEHMTSPISSPEHVQQRMRKVTAIMHDTLIDRRDNPRDDMISMLWQTELDGRPTTLNEIEDYCVLLFLAGLDTVMNGIGHAVQHYATHPELQDELRKHPERIADATEEMLRRYTFTVPPRYLKKDVEFHGATMKQGETANLFLPAADLDPAEFPTPEEFDLAREGKVHIAFGVGPHRCLGSHLARIELNILAEELMARLPAFRIDPSKEVRYHGGPVIGPEVLPLVWDA